MTKRPVSSTTRRYRGSAVVVFTLGLFLSSTSWSQTPSSPPQPPPDTPAGTWKWEPADHGVHLHDGFYARMAAGAGLIHAGFSHPTRTGSPTITAPALAWELGFGGSVAEGWTLGGRLVDVLAPSAEGYEITLSTSETGPTGTFDAKEILWLSMAQVFVDAYPIATRGFHFGAGVGPASLMFGNRKMHGPDAVGGSEHAKTETAYGIGSSLSVGWEGWVGKQWSMGGLLSISGARLWGNMLLVDTAILVFSPTLQFTATYN